MKKKIYVHIADDHKILIEGIIAVLNTDERFKVDGYSLTGKQVVEWTKTLRKNQKINVLVLDINMPEMDGFEVLKYLKGQNLNLKVIVLSSYDDIEIIQEMLTLGANGYISKNNAGEHILEAIRTVGRGEQYFSDNIKEQLLMLITTGKKRNKGDRPESIASENLTDRELTILRLIAKEYSTPEMAEMLNVSTSTIITYRKKLLKKLNVKNSVGLAMYALKHKII